MKLNLKNSIYSKGYSLGSGLEVKNGRLINNRPDGVSGIAEAVMIKKADKHARKMEMYSDAVALGYMKAEAMEGPESM